MLLYFFPVSQCYVSSQAGSENTKGQKQVLLSLCIYPALSDVSEFSCHGGNKSNSHNFVNDFMCYLSKTHTGENNI